MKITKKLVCIVLLCVSMSVLTGCEVVKWISANPSKQELQSNLEKNIPADHDPIKLDTKELSIEDPESVQPEKDGNIYLDLDGDNRSEAIAITKPKKKPQQTSVYAVSKPGFSYVTDSQEESYSQVKKISKIKGKNGDQLAVIYTEGQMTNSTHKSEEQKQTTGSSNSESGAEQKGSEAGNTMEGPYEGEEGYVGEASNEAPMEGPYEGEEGYNEDEGQLTLVLYSWSDEKLVKTLEQKIQQYTVGDLDLDGQDELAYTDEEFKFLKVVTLDQGVWKEAKSIKIKKEEVSWRINIGLIYDKQPALIYTHQKPEDKYISSKMYYLSKGSKSFLEKEVAHDKDIKGNSNNGITFPEDVNGDGILEFPLYDTENVQYSLDAYRGLTTWRQLQPNGNWKKLFKTYDSVRLGYRIKIPEKWDPSMVLVFENGYLRYDFLTDYDQKHAYVSFSNYESKMLGHPTVLQIGNYYGNDWEKFKTKHFNEDKKAKVQYKLIELSENKESVEYLMIGSGDPIKNWQLTAEEVKKMISKPTSLNTAYEGH